MKLRGSSQKRAVYMILSIEVEDAVTSQEGQFNRGN